jgi:hypothetical protein
VSTDASGKFEAQVGRFNDEIRGQIDDRGHGGRH